MKPIVHTHNRHAIVYDADRIKDPAPSLFSAEHWAQQGAVRGTAAGRGSALFIESGFGPAVLRQYLRGGWPARISRDRYIYTGYERSRPFREFRLLVQLSDLGLPAPVPLAGMIERAGSSYRGAILMERIEDVVPLDRLILNDQADEELFGRVGACIRRFHEAGVNHSDLNVRNILVHEDRKQVFLVDFDRGSIRTGARFLGRANLNRLQRSLRKYWPARRRHEWHSTWRALLQSYNRHD